MWTPLRKEILQISQQLKIPQERFIPVSIGDWKNILDGIFQKFCNPDRIGGIWERLKGDSYAVQFHSNYPFDQLQKLVESSEKVWLFLDETVSEKTKYWLYEGYISDIVRILTESSFVDEVYVASKKYEWLLCVNHHDYIITTGDKMSDKLMNLEKTV